MEGRSIPGSGGTSESSWGQLPDARSLGAATSDGGELSREGGRPGDQRPRPVDDDALSGTRFAFGGRNRWVDGRPRLVRTVGAAARDEQAHNGYGESHTYKTQPSRQLSTPTVSSSGM